MPEKLYEMLNKLGDLLHWLGKYEDANEIFSLCRLFREHNIEKADDLSKYLKD